jgi:hypothetical protein
VKVLSNRQECCHCGYTRPDPGCAAAGGSAAAAAAAGDRGTKGPGHLPPNNHKHPCYCMQRLKALAALLVVPLLLLVAMRM